MAFPTTSVLDTFNRANEGPPPSASWASTGILTGASGLSVVSNEMVDSGNGGAWGTTVGPDSEIFLTTGSALLGDAFSAYLFLRGVQIGAATADGYRVRFQRRDSNPGVRIIFYVLTDGGFSQIGSLFNETGGAISSGTKFGADIVGSTITAYINRSGSWTAITSEIEGTYSSSGSIMFQCDDPTATFDDFGGGTVVVPGPTATVAWMKA